MPTPTRDYTGIAATLRPTSFLEYLDDSQPRKPDNQNAGTVCERAIVQIYEGRIGRCIPTAELRQRLAEGGHAKSTIGRALTNLLRHKVLSQRADGLTYTGKGLPTPKKYFSIAGDERATNRFGKTRDLKAEARLVQAVLIERLEEIFEQPMSGLARVCQMLVAADRLGRAVELGMAKEAARQAEVVRLCRDELNGDAERRRAGRDTLNQPLGPPHVLDAIAIALFPSEYEEIPEAANRIAEYARAKQDADAAMNAALVEENERVMAANEKIDRENLERKALGLKELPREKTRPLINERELVDGLVIPDRLGEDRMKAFVAWYRGEVE